MASGEEEYIGRMRALGYVPTLAGMDDEDIEWELARMDRGRAAERPTAPQLNPTYRPVDPGLAARILRQMGRPYDPSAIDPREAVYIGGWDNGEDEEATRPAGPLVSQGGMRRPDVPWDPWANTWKLDWGAEGSPAQAPRTMEPKMTSFMYRGPDNDRDYIQLAGGTPTVREVASSEEGAKRADVGSKGNWGKGVDVAKDAIKLNKFGEKAYNAAKEQGYSHDDAMEIAQESQIMYGTYMMGDAYLGKRLRGLNYFIKEVGQELTEDELHRHIIETTINNRKLRQNPPEGSILPP